MSHHWNLAGGLFVVSMALVACSSGSESGGGLEQPIAGSPDPVPVTAADVALTARSEPAAPPTLPAVPGCYWLAPEQGAARVAAVGGIDLVLGAVGPIQGSTPHEVEVLHAGSSEEGQSEQDSEVPPQSLLRLTIDVGAETACATGCIVEAHLEQGLAVGPSELLARIYSESGALLCESSNAVHVNAPPEVMSLRVDPELPEAATNVHFEVEVFDPDGDELVSSHAWVREDGHEVHDRILEGRETRPGEKWTLKFSVQDPFERPPAKQVEFSIKLPIAQAERFCEPGTRLHGLGPPWDDETWCEKQLEGGTWQRHGFHRRWWSAAKDLIKSEEEWREGRKHGSWTSWYENGKTSYLASWEQGQLNGPAQAWHDNGSRSAEYSFEKGEKHGIEVNWFREGGEQYRMDEFVEGRKNGVETRWYRNGNKQDESHWKEGRRYGKQTSWHPHGAVLEERSYLNGSWQRWHANGIKAAQGQHENGRPIGEWLRWNENGDVEDGEAVP